MIEAKMPILHNGRAYREGDKITDITPEQAAILVECGAADWQRLIPESVASSVSKPDQGEGASVKVDWDEEVKQYHKGFGNYEIPGVGNVKGKEAAIEALKQARDGN